MLMRCANALPIVKSIEDQFEAEQKALEQAQSPQPVTTKGKAAKPK